MNVLMRFSFLYFMIKKASPILFTERGLGGNDVILKSRVFRLPLEWLLGRVVLLVPCTCRI